MEIEINPAHETPRVLRAFAAFLVALADGADRQCGVGAAAIAADDNPEAGANLKATENRPLPETAGQVIGFKRFTNDVPGPAQAFGAGSTHGSAALDADAAYLNAVGGAGTAGPTLADIGLPGPAAAFGGGPVTAGLSAVPNVAPPPPNGPPALPSATPPTLPPTSSAPTAEWPFPGGHVPSAAPAPAHAGSTSHVQVDAEGLPWDVRIHSTPAKINAGDKKWKAKRGVSESDAAPIKAALKAALSVPNGPSPAANVASTTPAPLAPPPGIPGTPTPGAAGGASMATILPRVTSAITGGLLTPDQTAQILHELSGGQVTNVAMLAVAPQLIPAFAARLDQLGIAP